MKINEKVAKIIEERMHLYEKEYEIEVLMWSLRGSMDVGIYRENSDLDILFLYRSENKEVRAIHDIVGHGFDYWGWILEDAILTVEKSNEVSKLGESFLLSSEHKRASLDYYHGLYCAINNEYAIYTEVFVNQYFDYLKDLYRIDAVVAWMNSRLEKTIAKINVQEYLTGAELLNALWYALMSKHAIMGSEPGDNKLNKLLDLYATETERKEVKKIHDDYRLSKNKNARRYFNNKLYDLITNQYKNNIVYIKEVCNDEN